MNTLDFLKETYGLLKEAHIETLVFGGWAEELHGLIAPRTHNDIDLLYPAGDFTTVDAFLKKNDFKIVKAFPHKRAFLYKGIMVELFLVTDESTDFFSLYKHLWPAHTFAGARIEEMRVCSVESLKDFRDKHHLVEEAYRTYIIPNIL